MTTSIKDLFNKVIYDKDASWKDSKETFRDVDEELDTLESPIVEPEDKLNPIIKAPPGPPPREGLVWRERTHRWVLPDTSEESGRSRTDEFGEVYYPDEFGHQEEINKDGESPELEK